ncbi:hypothetical protein [Enterococcus faecalis]|uniref:hypothetical protein n=1 Tax=Enterococcus faecalis TaxID=1351 RepID=UPI000A19C84A|nr:hypothetical protein [Enterococcus faecalis]EHZ5577422.1 hypothetical protein [Enterococcus faecalis]OSM28439.1 hypothetical protein B6E65_03865 [Enterococcus faecalis]
MANVNQSYLKQMKNWIVVISSVSMIVNLYLGKDFVALLLTSFTYISSQGLTFYALNPGTEKGDYRRNLLVKSSIALVALTMCGLIIESKIKSLPLLIMSFFIIMKLLIGIFSLYVIYCSFSDNKDYQTKEEFDITKNIRKTLTIDYEKKQKDNIFSERNFRQENNEKTRKFLLRKKRETEGKK